jgi:hypothetical protein
MTPRALGYAAVVALSVACDPGIIRQSGSIEWLEWPAEVKSATSFQARAILLPPACLPHQFRPGRSVEQSAITFEPYWLVEPVRSVCPPTGPDHALLPDIRLDTLLAVPGLAASSPRTVEMRAATSAPISEPVIRTFGDVTVRPADPDTSRRNAAGRVTLRVDEQGCARIQPGGFFYPVPEYVLEDQADTAGIAFAFVRGYLHDVATPVCGQTRVFHLVTVN